jgi:hypothetical protein
VAQDASAAMVYSMAQVTPSSVAAVHPLIWHRSLWAWKGDDLEVGRAPRWCPVAVAGSGAKNMATTFSPMSVAPSQHAETVRRSVRVCSAAPALIQGCAVAAWAECWMMHDHQAIPVSSETSRSACWSVPAAGGCLASLAGDAGACGGLVGGRAPVGRARPCQWR